MSKGLRIFALIVTGMISGVQAQYAGWKQSGQLTILTTPEGANLPATAAEKDFPLLIRLNKEAFDFQQAKPSGEDIRFSAAGQPLAYQIETWDAAKGSASIWVRIPLIKGNARQEITMHWGKPDAASESNGKAVFNASNGFISVFHMTEPVQDAVASIQPKDTGTQASQGIVGAGRRFGKGRLIECGEKLTVLPTNSAPNSTSLWMKPEAHNLVPIAWGNHQPQGKVVMHFESPPHIKMDCHFSGANVESVGKLPLNEWLYVVHTYKPNESRIYVNGVLVGESTAKGLQNIRSPAKFTVGGWGRDGLFEGELDEARLSSMTRSADWVKMEYENQKPLQTLVGTLVKPGSDFSVSEKKLVLREGQSATITATAGGAQKVYWILKADGKETLASVDSFSFVFPATRVTGDQTVNLQFKAITATGVKTADIPVTIKEEIPDPVFSIKVPEQWDGRTTLEVIPQITNLAAMQAKGAGELKYSWDVSGMATIHKGVPGKLTLLRAQNSGKLVLTATIQNGGAAVTQSATIQVTEPKQDAWVQRVPEKDEKPVDGQFTARDDKNEGTLFYNGTLSETADEVFLKLYADEKLIKTEYQKFTLLGAGVTAPSSGVGGQGYTPAAGAYAFTLKLKPGLIQYKVELGTKTAGQEKVLETVNDLVCGDAFLIDGQSNALATDTKEESPLVTNKWIRSYGGPAGRWDGTKWVETEFKGKGVNPWCYPVWKARLGEKAELGWWGMELAKRLLESQKVPIFILQAAVGGTRIDEHQRNEANPTDLTTIYGRMLWRLQHAKMTHGIRAVIWHQGEADQGSYGPSGGYGWESYQQYFIAMSAAWKQDLPNIQHYYIFQIWPNSCSMGGKIGSGDMVREKQRTLPSLYSNMGILSTLGIRPPGPCHYPLEGWSVFARMLQPLIEKDIYGKVPAGPVTAANVRSAKYAGTAQDKIALEFDQPVVWSDTLAGQFYLDNEPGKVASGAVSGNVLTLNLQGPSSAKTITYLKETAWSQDTLLNGANGIAALTFRNVPIE